MSPTDYAQTAHARENRAAKARQLAAAAWDRGLTGDDLLALDAAGRRALARQVDVNPPKDPGDTWPAVLDLLEAKRVWADAHPGDPRARRGAVPVGGPVVVSDTPVDAAIPAKHEPSVASSVHTPDPPVYELAPNPDTAGAVVVPKGWEARVAAHPPLTRPDARCCVCRRPAIVASGHQWRCADHPPQPGDIGARLDWSPRHPAAGCGLGRCYCTRCPDFVIQPPPSAVPAPTERP